MTIRRISVQPLDPSLVHRFATGDGVLWLGSGVSSAWRYADDGTLLEPGVPPVKALTNRLLERGLKEDTTNLDLADCGSRFVQQRGRPALDRIIQDWYDGATTQSPRFYALLAQLPREVREFVTTNYDPFTERARTTRGPVVVVVKARELDRRGAAHTVVYKVHGDAQDPAGCVLTTRDYDRWEAENELLLAKLKDLFTHKTIVMVGYSVRDRHFVRILSQVASLIRQAGGAIQPLHVVMPNPGEEDFAVFDEHDLDVVLIDATGDRFLESLLAGLRAHRAAEVHAQLLDVIEAADVREARTEVRNARTEDQRSVAAERVALAEILERRGRRNEALRERSGALDDLQSAGVTEDELAKELAPLLERALVRGVDPVAVAHDASGCMARGAYDTASTEHRFQLFVAAGRVLARRGDGEAAARMADRVGELAAGSPAEARRFAAAAARLRAAGALCTEHFAEAAAQWRCAADQEDEPEVRMDSSIRAALCTGLAGDLDRGTSEINSIEPSAPLRALWYRASAWLATLAMDVERAADTFRIAAQDSLAAGDAAAAVVALRNATWAQARGTSWILQEDEDLTKAGRLRRLGAANAEERPYDLDALLEDAYQALAFDDIRAAERAAEGAVAMVLEEIDPLGLEWVRGVQARVWMRATELRPEPESLENAALYTALSGAQDAFGAQSSLIKRVEAVLRNHASLSDIVEIVGALATTPVGLFEQAGALRVLDTFADLAPAGVMDSIVQTVLSGLSAPWAVSKANDVPSVACGLARTIAANLADAHAAAIRDRLVARLDDTPPSRRKDTLKALCTYLERAPLLGDSTSALGDRLLGMLSEGDEDRYGELLRICLGLLAVSAGPEVRDRVLAALDSHDETDWTVRALAWRANGGPTREEADRFFLEEAARLETILSRECVTENSSIIYQNPVFRMPAQLAAPHATPHIRARVLELALRAAEHLELLRPERGSWLDYASRLAPHSEDDMENVVDVMSRAARGQAPRMRQLGIETEHPLSSIFVDEGSISVVQARALAAMVRVYRRAAAPLRERIEAEWAYATHNADAGVRATVARAVAATHADLGSGLPSGGAATAAVALLAADPNADVRSTAYQALGAAAAASDGAARAELLAVLRRAAESETAAVALLAINSAYEVASGASAGAAGLD